MHLSGPVILETICGRRTEVCGPSQIMEAAVIICTPLVARHFFICLKFVVVFGTHPNQEVNNFTHSFIMSQYTQYTDLVLTVPTPNGANIYCPSSTMDPNFYYYWLSNGNGCANEYSRSQLVGGSPTQLPISDFTCIFTSTPAKASYTLYCDYSITYTDTTTSTVLSFLNPGSYPTTVTTDFVVITQTVPTTAINTVYVTPPVQTVTVTSPASGTKVKGRTSETDLEAQVEAEQSKGARWNDRDWAILESISEVLVESSWLNVLLGKRASCSGVQCSDGSCCPSSQMCISGAGRCCNGINCIKWNPYDAFEFIFATQYSTVETTTTTTETTTQYDTGQAQAFPVTELTTSYSMETQIITSYLTSTLAASTMTVTALNAGGSSAALPGPTPTPSGPASTASTALPGSTGLSSGAVSAVSTPATGTGTGPTAATVTVKASSTDRRRTKRLSFVLVHTIALVLWISSGVV